MWILELLMYLAYVAMPTPWLFAFGKALKLNKSWMRWLFLVHFSLVVCFVFGTICEMFRNIFWSSFAVTPILHYFAEGIANVLTLSLGLACWGMMLWSWKKSPALRRFIMEDLRLTNLNN